MPIAKKLVTLDAWNTKFYLSSVRSG